MDMAYDLGANVISRFVTDLRMFLAGRQKMKESGTAVKSIVMMPGHAEDISITETGICVEIRDAFNEKLCIQRYEKNGGKVILYIPENWGRTISIKTKKADIYCFLENPCDCLELYAEEGAILYRKKEETVSEL